MAGHRKTHKLQHRTRRAQNRTRRTSSQRKCWRDECVVAKRNWTTRWYAYFTM